MVFRTCEVGQQLAAWPSKARAPGSEPRDHELGFLYASCVLEGHPRVSRRLTAAPQIGTTFLQLLSFRPPLDKHQRPASPNTCV
jgi:hypothetical protein